MRVLIVVPSLSAFYGGPSFCANGLAAALGRGSLEVDVITTNAAGPKDDEMPLDQWVSEPDFRVRYFPRVTRSEIKFSPAMAAWIYRHVTDYQLVHGMSVFNFPAFIYPEICIRRGLPFIIHPQGMFEPWSMTNKAWKKKYYFGYVQLRQIQRASVIHCLTRHEAASLKELGATSPMVVIPNGVNSDELEKGNHEMFFREHPELKGKTLLLFLHRVDRKKGLDILAKAIVPASVADSALHVVIAGPDATNYWREAQEFFREAGVLDRVTYVGMLKGGMKKAALAAADIFVAPSYSEGFSMAVIEAMAAGLPCVITKGCNFPEAAAANAVVETEVDAEDFANGLVRLLNNPSERKEMGRRARDLIASDYTWDRVAAKTCEVYKAILTGGPIPYRV